MKTTLLSRRFEHKSSTEQDINILRQKVERLRNNPSEASALLMRAGIYNAEGNLTKAFGGKA